MTDRDFAARARERAKFMQRLDELAAARRLAHLRDASGNFNPVHQARYFYLSWMNRRLVEKLVARDRKREAQRPTVRLIIDNE
jgi:hypothetical protein